MLGYIVKNIQQKCCQCGLWNAVDKTTRRVGDLLSLYHGYRGRSTTMPGQINFNWKQHEICSSAAAEPSHKAVTCIYSRKMPWASAIDPDQIKTYISYGYWFLSFLLKKSIFLRVTCFDFFATFFGNKSGLILLIFPLFIIDFCGVQDLIKIDQVWSNLIKFDRVWSSWSDQIWFCWNRETTWVLLGFHSFPYWFF